MRSCKRLSRSILDPPAIALVVAAQFLFAPPSLAASTWSFSKDERGSHPHTMKGTGELIVDLSALPAGARIVRARLFLDQDARARRQGRLEPVLVRAAGAPLRLVGPRYDLFDATDAVKEAEGKLAIQIESLPGHYAGAARLDVTGDFPAATPSPPVRNLRAWHVNGQTFLTWTYPEGVDFQEDLLLSSVPIVRKNRRLQFRIYRSEKPITAENLLGAEFVDEVDELTGWNETLPGMYPAVDPALVRYVVEDGGEPLPPNAGVYVLSVPEKRKSYYAVSMAENGAEDFSVVSDQNATREALEESTGPGVYVLQRTDKPEQFHFIQGATLLYFVRWESPPTSNLPSQAHNYLVALPPGFKKGAPAGLHLHCWGGNLEGGYGWWYAAGKGAVLLSTNEVPYDWWTGYHEAWDTRRSWKEGVVVDYTQRRLLAFADWAAERFELDKTRWFVGGVSMGGSGATSLAIRHPERFAWATSWVGVHSPARSPRFQGSYEEVFGPLEARLPSSAGPPAFDWFDNRWFTERNVQKDFPILCFANGKNDDAIGWAQAVDFWRALQEARQPHVFVWGQGGHGQRAALPGPKIDQREPSLEWATNRTLPVFTRSTLDDDPGGGDPASGAPDGQSNLYLYWVTSPKAVVDEADRWSMVLRVHPEAPRERAEVDVTPRRCQAFRPAPGSRVDFRVEEPGARRLLKEGSIEVDKYGLATVPKVPITRRGVRLILDAGKN